MPHGDIFSGIRWQSAAFFRGNCDARSIGLVCDIFRGRGISLQIAGLNFRGRGIALQSAVEITAFIICPRACGGTSTSGVFRVPIKHSCLFQVAHVSSVDAINGKLG
jgi:hypothetical protein